MRYYLPGIGRFVSRVRLHEAVAMSRTTYEELRKVWGINIGPLGSPEAFARNGELEHPYAYCDNNPIIRIDPSGQWWKNLHGDWSSTAASVAGFNSKGCSSISQAAMDIDNIITLGRLPHFPWLGVSRLQYASNKSDEARVDWKKEKCPEALEHLGHGCHAVQDDTTHPENPLRHRDWMDDPSHAGNAPKAKAAQDNSKDYLKAFIGSISKCKCSAYLK